MSTVFAILQCSFVLSSTVMNDISHDHCYGIVVCTWCSSNFEEENGEDEEKK